MSKYLCVCNFQKAKQKSENQKAKTEKQKVKTKR